MRFRRFLLASGFTACLTLAFFTSRSEATPGELKEIVKGVWFREGELEDKGHCNNVIIEMKDYLVVVDANFPSGARLAMEAAKRVSSKPVKYVFDTHHHGDHAYGNAVWTKAGATTLAYVGVVQEMQAREPARWQAAAKERKDVAELGLKTAQPPMKTFDKSPFVLEDETRRIEFHHFGWAHTKGDGFAYLPKEKVLCTGDAMLNGPYNYTGDGNIGNWPNVAKGAAKLNPQYVLPGHGPSGGKEILEGQGRFMQELRSQVQAARAHGKKLGELVTMKEGKPVATTVALSPAVKNWVGKSLPTQVRDAWLELENGKPRGDQPE